MRIATALAVALSAALGLGALAGCASAPEQRRTGEVLDDTVLTARVKKAIFDQEGVSVMDVNVTTFRGVVQLSGFVPTANDARMAEEAALRVQGVKSVKNDIRVAPRS